MEFTNPFEGVPTEIKLRIIEMVASDSFLTLLNLVEASPAYCAVYETFERKFVTIATLEALTYRLIDIFAPASFLEVNVTGNIRPINLVKTAILACREAKRDNKEA